MQQIINSNVEKWLNGNFEQSVKEEIKHLQQTNPDELADSFYKNLEFGTGGLRGIMGIGTNRMNKYTVGMATQGYANYLNQSFGHGNVKCVVGHDSRNNSRLFSEIVANVMAANGIQVYLFEELRPTPELSFAIRHLGCQGGVVCTASHNPKEYNGYKAYWNDGGQLVPPHDKNVILEVDKVVGVDDVKWSGGEKNITLIGRDIDVAYMQMIESLSVYPEVCKAQHDLKIVYTSIHGTGITLVPEVLQRFGFTNVTVVDEQKEPNGNFPTVVYPNPEEAEAMSIGLNKAKQIDADILLGTDPDSDRVGIGVKDLNGNWVLMNGNQTAVLAFNYMIEARKAKGINQPNDMVVKTIVTTEMIDAIAKASGINCYNVLTGFKWIAELIKEKEATENYIIGGEESYGLMIGSKIRDKDAISAVALLCEMAAYEKNKGKNLYEKMIDLYVQHGFYKESLISITKKGMNGQAEIAEMMQGYRDNTPTVINNSAVVQLLDYQLQKGKNVSAGPGGQTGEEWTIKLPKSNVLQFILADGSKISARPSGTEPKIKFYFSVNGQLDKAENFETVHTQLNDRISGIILSMGLK